MTIFFELASVLRVPSSPPRIWLWVLVVTILAALFGLSAGASNLANLALLRCLAQEGGMGRLLVDRPRCTERMAASVANPILGLLNINVRSGIIQSFETFVKMERRPKGVYAVPMPAGLPGYEYWLASQAASAGEWARSLEFFERAINYSPRGWSLSFYDRYREALARIAPGIVERMEQEAASPATAGRIRQIRLGRKEQPGWETPIPIAGVWQLESLAVRSWTALEHGFPITVDLFWTSPSGTVERQTGSVISAFLSGPKGGLT